MCHRYLNRVCLLLSILVLLIWTSGCTTGVRGSARGESGDSVSRRIVKSLADHHHRQESRLDGESDVVDTMADDRLMIRVRTHRKIHEVVVSVVFDGKTQLVWTRSPDGRSFVLLPEQRGSLHIDMQFYGDAICFASAAVAGTDTILWRLDECVSAPSPK